MNKPFLQVNHLRPLRLVLTVFMDDRDDLFSFTEMPSFHLPELAGGRLILGQLPGLQVKIPAMERKGAV